jgi:hypothetical protein
VQRNRMAPDPLTGSPRSQPDRPRRRRPERCVRLPPYRSDSRVATTLPDAETTCTIEPRRSAIVSTSIGSARLAG